MSRLKKLEDQIRNVLERFPETRNSDQLLTVKIWEIFCHDKLTFIGGRYFAALDDIREVLPREDHIKRLRARIQNEQHEYLPTSWEVAKQRGWEELKWQEFLNRLSLKDEPVVAKVVQQSFLPGVIGVEIAERYPNGPY